MNNVDKHLKSLGFEKVSRSRLKTIEYTKAVGHGVNAIVLVFGGKNRSKSVEVGLAVTEVETVLERAETYFTRRVALKSMEIIHRPTFYAKTGDTLANNSPDEIFQATKNLVETLMTPPSLNIDYLNNLLRLGETPQAFSRGKSVYLAKRSLVRMVLDDKYTDQHFDSIILGKIGTSGYTEELKELRDWLINDSMRC